MPWLLTQPALTGGILLDRRLFGPLFPEPLIGLHSYPSNHHHKPSLQEDFMVASSSLPEEINPMEKMTAMGQTWVRNDNR